MTHRSTNSRHVGFALASLAAFAVAPMAAQAAVANAPPSILVFNQKAAGNAVSVDYVNLPADGYVVIYASDEKGQRTGDPLGALPLKAGSHMDVKVELSKAPAKGAGLWASLYKDKDGKEGFDRTGDKAVWANIPLQNAFTIE